MPTAIDPIDPTLILNGLERLKKSVSTTVAAEDELERSRRERFLKLSREISGRERSDADGFEIRYAELHALHQDATAREQIAYERRKENAKRAYQASRASLARRLQILKDEHVNKAQGAILTERKKLQQPFDQAITDHAALEEQLLADRAERLAARDSQLQAFPLTAAVLISLFEKKPAAFSIDESSSAAEFRQDSLKQIELLRQSAEDTRRQWFANRAIILPLIALIVVLLLLSLKFGTLPFVAAVVLAGGWLAGFTLAFLAANRASKIYQQSQSLALQAEKVSAAAITKIEAEISALEQNQTSGLVETFQETDNDLKIRTDQGHEKLKRQLARLPDKMLDLHRIKLAKIDRAHSQAVSDVRQQASQIAASRSLARSGAATASDAVGNAAIQKLVEPWQTEVVSLREHLELLEKSSRVTSPAWTPDNTASWKPTTAAPQAIRIGQLKIDAAKFPGGLPKHALLGLPQPAVFSAPLALGFPDHGSLLIETDGVGAAANEALNAIAIRLLATLPPGRASFVFIDPVGLGRGFAGLMHLADYEETLISNRIWTQATHIEERLAELNEHIEKVIQMYLRNEFATIAEYNEQAGSIAEKYRFLVITGFPAGFSETAAKRLLSIATSGARCGVHLLIQQDLRQPVPDPALAEELRRACLCVTFRDDVFRLDDAVVVFDPPPADEDAITLIHRIGKASIDSNRVEVPFAQIAPPADALWNSDTSDELRVPIGRTGAKKLQLLALGKGTRQHALIAGKTGSGKSTLFHVIITNLALWCSPAQVEFYLVDFKKGVEFKCYADRKLPHARVIAIESDREFALSVLQRVDAELKHRGELFRKSGSQDLASYNSSGANQRLPRTLLLIDEFQEFFTEDDSVAQQASLLLDRIVRQGRAFGIHAILGSQTLGGAYTLARATLGQMAVRIALQCNEADAHLIMDEENPAPRLLTRPGEGIYNDQSGMMVANSPFQIVWLPERERDAILDQVNGLARRDFTTPPVPIIFEGNAPAEIRDNPELTKALRQPATSRPATASAWLGAPNSIKGPTAAIFKRQSGSNLLVVSQSEEQTIALLASAIVSLAAQYPPELAEFIVLDPQAADDAHDGILKRLTAKLPHRIQLAGPADIAAQFTSLAATLESRAANSGKDAPEIFIIIHDLQRFKALRPDDEFRFSYDESTSGPSPSQALAALLGEGGPSGLHVLASIDTWNNVSRWIPRKLLAEFEMRVLFQMSAADSSNLIDSPDASHLGLHRALFHNEHLGTLETFRPYAAPEDVWIEKTMAPAPVG